MKTSKILNFPRNLSLIRNLSEGRFNNTISRIAFDPALACNLNCEMCPWARSGYHNNVYFSSEEFPNFYNCLKEAGISHLQIGSDAEPTVHPEINKLIGLFSNSNISTSAITNLNCSKEKINSLGKVDLVNVSVDGGNKETYEEVRRGGNWELLCKNLEELSEKTDINIKWVLLGKNYRTLPEFIETLNELNRGGISKIDIGDPHFHSEENEEEGFSENFIKKNQIEEFISLLDESKEMAKNFSVNYYPNLNNYEIKEHLIQVISSKNRVNYGKYPCFHILRSLYIDARGDVKPCCDALYSDFSLGNIKKQSLKSIIESDSFIKMKDSLLTCGFDKKPEFCKICFRKSHRDVYKLLKKFKMDRIFNF